MRTFVYIAIGAVSLYLITVLVLVLYHRYTSSQGSSPPSPPPGPSPGPPPGPPPSPSPGPGPSPSPNSNEWIDAHNRVRQEAWGPTEKLHWNNDLAQQSLDYANNLASSGTFQHGDKCAPHCRGSACSGGQTCGQNLEMATPSTSPSQAVQHWYNEKGDYHGGCDQNPINCEKSGHYTQLVWKGAREVGCGISGNGQIAACLYDIGNEIGQFSQNVPS